MQMLLSIKYHEEGAGMDARRPPKTGRFVGGQRVGDSKGRRRLRALWPGPGNTISKSQTSRAWGGTTPLEIVNKSRDTVSVQALASPPSSYFSLISPNSRLFP